MRIQSVEFGPEREETKTVLIDKEALTAHVFFEVKEVAAFHGLWQEAIWDGRRFVDGNYPLPTCAASHLSSPFSFRLIAKRNERNRGMEKEEGAHEV